MEGRLGEDVPIRGNEVGAAGGWSKVTKWCYRRMVEGNKLGAYMKFIKGN
jgi:hypothetical protein